MTTEQSSEEKELAEKLRNMTDQEVIDYYNSRPMKKYDRLNFAYVKVHVLLDYMKVINSNHSQLVSPANRVSAQSGKVSPSAMLWQYVIMEVCSFYEVIEKMMNQGVSGLPEIPEYYRKILKSFRGQVIAHLNPHGNLQTTADWMAEFTKANKIPAETILNDFEGYYKSCRAILRNDMS